MRFPEIDSCERLPDGVKLCFTVPSNLDWFEGHFKRVGILPGVAMCVFVQEFATRYLDFDLYASFTGVMQTKFQKTILADTRLELTLINNTSARVLDFTAVSEGITCVTGRMSYDPALV